MSNKTAKNTQKKSWQGQVYDPLAAPAWDQDYMPPPGFGLPPPWLSDMQSDLLWNFANQLDPYQVTCFLTPEAQSWYYNNNYQRKIQEDPPCFDLPWNMLHLPVGNQCMPQMFADPLGTTMSASYDPALQGKTKQGKKKGIGDTDQGENQEKEKDKATDFLEGEVYFSRWEEWHELQRAINHGKLNGKMYDVAFAEWQTWVQQWREPDAAWQKLQNLQKDIDGYRKELEALDKKFGETGGHTDKMDWKKRMEQAISDVEQTECMPEEEEDEEEEKDEDKEREKKMKKILSGKIWDWFKQKRPPPWQVQGEEWDSLIEPAGKEWWKGKVNKLSQNINVHADGTTYKNSSTNPKKVNCMSTRAIQMEIEKGNEEVRGRIYAELKGNSKELVKHVDGHHVLKEVLNQSGSQPASSPSQVEWIMDDILGTPGMSIEEQQAEWVKLAKQRYGCRVLISMLNRMQSATIQPIIKALVDHESNSTSELAKHKFGFYVIQVLVEDQTAWEDDPKKEPIKQALRELINRLTSNATNLMKPDEKNEKDGAQEGKKSNNNNPDCNGAAVLCKAMRNPCIPWKESKALYDSVLCAQNHKWLVAMGCTRFGEEAVKSALGTYAAEDGMTENSRVDDALLDAAVQYLVKPEVAKQLEGCRYGKLLLKCVKKTAGDLPARSDSDDEAEYSE